MWGKALAGLVRGCRALVAGADQRAAAMFGDAAGLAHACDMGVHAAVARLRLAELAGDGAAVAAAEDVLRTESVVAPRRLAALYAPGAGS